MLGLRLVQRSDVVKTLASVSTDVDAVGARSEEEAAFVSTDGCAVCARSVEEATSVCMDE